jgi:hypothetical protein
MSAMKTWTKITISLLLIIVCASISHAQAIKVTGGFLNDSIKVGEQTRFFLSAKYPSKFNVLFPDSTFSFSPFEYQTRKYFATETRDSISTDSTIYFLTTFELDSVQYLDLPVFLVNEQDCTTFISNRDSLLLSYLVTSVPDSIAIDKLPLKSNVNYQQVGYEFNYLILGIVVAVLIVVFAIVWILFGRRIMRYFKAKRLQKRHVAFLDKYHALVRQVQDTFSTSATEAAYVLWKQYMEDLESRPYTKLTTRELLILQPDETLGNNLRVIDRAIYGHNMSVAESLDGLRKVADERFQKKIQEVKHGK